MYGPLWSCHGTEIEIISTSRSRLSWTAATASSCLLTTATVTTTHHLDCDAAWLNALCVRPVRCVALMVGLRRCWLPASMRTNSILSVIDARLWKKSIVFTTWTATQLGLWPCVRDQFNVVLQFAALLVGLRRSLTAWSTCEPILPDRCLPVGWKSTLRSESVYSRIYCVSMSVTFLLCHYLWP